MAKGDFQGTNPVKSPRARSGDILLQNQRPGRPDPNHETQPRIHSRRDADVFDASEMTRNEV